MEENGCVIDLSNKRLIIQGDQNQEETTAEIILIELSYTDEDIEESSGQERDWLGGYRLTTEDITAAPDKIRAIQGLQMRKDPLLHTWTLILHRH